MPKGKSLTTKSIARQSPEGKPKKPHDISDFEVEKLKLIASHVKELREAKYSSYEHFALQAGINRNSYFRFEKAARTGENYTMALLLKVIKGLDLKISEFFQDIK